MVNLVILLMSFIPLIYGATLLVDGSSSLAKRLNIPNIVIGLTIVAFGTSAPELVVNIFASISKDSSIVLGNIIGSNIFNILGILGIAAIVYPLSVKSNTTWIEIPLCLLSAVAVFFIANDGYISNSPLSQIDRVDGLILILFFLIFLVYNFQLLKLGNSGEEVAVPSHTLLKSIIFIAVGLSLLIIGGKLIVEYAKNFAKNIGISDRIIALTVVSIGTSLPELATSIIAAMKKNVDIAIGNVVGSNIFNVFLILGTSAIITPVTVTQNTNTDLFLNMTASLLLFIFVFTGKGRKIERWEGVILLTILIIYIVGLTLFNA